MGRDTGREGVNYLVDMWMALWVGTRGGTEIHKKDYIAMRPETPGSVGKLNMMDSIPNFLSLLGTADSGMGRLIQCTTDNT